MGLSAKSWALMFVIFLVVCHPKKRPPQVYTSNSILPIDLLHSWWVAGAFFWGAKPTGKLLKLMLCFISSRFHSLKTHVFFNFSTTVRFQHFFLLGDGSGEIRSPRTAGGHAQGSRPKKVQWMEKCYSERISTHFACRVLHWLQSILFSSLLESQPGYLILGHCPYIPNSYFPTMQVEMQIQRNRLNWEHTIPPSNNRSCFSHETITL